MCWLPTGISDPSSVHWKVAAAPDEEWTGTALQPGSTPLSL